MPLKRQKKRSTPRGKNSVPPHLWCMYPTEHGPCEAPRTKWGDDYAARCRHHKNSDPDELPLENLKDLRYFLADVLKRTRKGQLESKIATACAQVATVMTRVIVADMKLDPNKAAQRQLSFEEAMKRASEMTLEEARQITERRDLNFLEDLLKSKIEIVEIETADDMGSKQQLGKAITEIDRIVDLIEEGDAEDILEGL